MNYRNLHPTANLFLFYVTEDKLNWSKKNPKSKQEWHDVNQFYGNFYSQHLKKQVIPNTMKALNRV